MTARVLGLDYGDARIGLALSDELGFLAHPHGTLHVKEGRVIERLTTLVREQKAAAVVVGLPRNMDGSSGASADKARAFAAELAAAIAPTPVHLWDERLSTVAAARSLQQAGKNARQQKKLIDQAAAQVILQGWLDSQSDGLLGQGGGLSGDF